jgi:hypothetical protein
LRGAQPRRLLALLDGELAAELADELALALGVERHLAGDEHEVAAAHRRHVVGGGAAAGGSVNAELDKPRVDLSGHGFLPTTSEIGRPENSGARPRVLA